jgi:hypothetical protein
MASPMRGITMDRSPALRTGKTVDLILSPNIIKRTHVLDVIDDCVVLADPKHSYNGRDKDRAAILTFLPNEQPNTRYGFDVVFVSAPDNYDASGKAHAAFVLKTSQTRKMDLRAFPRITIEGLSIFLGDEQLDIMDVSAGGAHLRLKKEMSRSVTAGNTVVLSLVREGRVLEREARIIRLWYVWGFSRTQHLAVKFLQPVDF